MKIMVLAGMELGGAELRVGWWLPPRKQAKSWNQDHTYYSWNPIYNLSHWIYDKEKRCSHCQFNDANHAVGKSRPNKTFHDLKVII